MRTHTRTRTKISPSLMIAGGAIAAVALTAVPAAPAQAVNSTFLVLNNTANTLELSYKSQPSEAGFEYRTPKVTPWDPTYLGPQQSHMFDPWWMYLAWERDATVKYTIGATGETVTIVMTPQFNNNGSRPVATCSIERGGGLPPINTCTVTGGSGAVTSTIEISARSATYTITNLTGTTIDPWPKDLNGASVPIPSDAYQFRHFTYYTHSARTDAPVTTYNWMVGITPTKFFTTFQPNAVPEKSAINCATINTKGALLPYVCYNDDASKPGRVVVNSIPNMGYRWAKTDITIAVDDRSMTPNIRQALTLAIQEYATLTNFRFSVRSIPQPRDQWGDVGMIRVKVGEIPDVPNGPKDQAGTTRSSWNQKGDMEIGITTIAPEMESGPVELTKALIMHELMHAIGFRHQDNVVALIGAAGPWGPGNPTTFTAYDLAAINAWYPVPVH